MNPYLDQEGRPILPKLTPLHVVQYRGLGWNKKQFGLAYLALKNDLDDANAKWEWCPFGPTPGGHPEYHYAEVTEEQSPFIL